MNTVWADEEKALLLWYNLKYQGRGAFGFDVVRDVYRKEYHMELLIDHVSKRFRDKRAVSDISLELTPGVWGLLGANGAGKTTLMRMIAGNLQPDAGQIVYDGVPIGMLGERYRDIFGFLPQEFGFHQDFTVGDYLTYVAALKGLDERQGRRRIQELLERVSLLDVRGRKIARLSGGMKRRVGIAQALLNDPEVLILDEPTGGLDPGERVRFRNLLSEFAHDRIVLISTHIVCMWLISSALWVWLCWCSLWYWRRWLWCFRFLPIGSFLRRKDGVWRILGQSIGGIWER